MTHFADEDFPEPFFLDTEPLIPLTEDGEPIWIGKDGTTTPISRLDDDHLLFCHRLVKSYLNWKPEWLTILFMEIRLRGLKPLPKKTFLTTRIRKFYQTSSDWDRIIEGYYGSDD